MNEANNRRVLVSVKVSTLLIILLSIIAVVVLVNVVSNKISNTSKNKINTAQIEESNIENNSEQIDSHTQRSIQATVTSRSLVTARTSSHEEINTIEEVFNEPEEEEIVEEIVTTPIEEVTISKDMDLTVRTGLSKEDFITLISAVKYDKTNFFEENASLIYDVCETYQLNEIFFCGLIAAESGWNIAQNHRNTYNYISLMSNKGLIKYSSVEEGMEKAASSLHDNYLTPGGRFYHGSTLAGMKTRFCPASSTWVNLVYNTMQQVLEK